jgi:hypothetical protein
MKMPIVAILLAVSVGSAAGCTARSAHVQAPEVKSRYLITMGDTDRPYRSLGYLQLTRKGADIFGFVSIVDADLNKMFGEELIKELAARGADGIINVEFRERQWTTGERLIFLIPPLWIVPIPTKVELRGELVRFTDRRPGDGRVSLAGE